MKILLFDTLVKAIKLHYTLIYNYAFRIVACLGS
jgi:hypothetical protein